MPFIPSPRDISEVVLYAVEHDGVNSMQFTGGSTFKAETEEKYITAYMQDMLESGAREALKGELPLLRGAGSGGFRALRRDLSRKGKESTAGAAVFVMLCRGNPRTKEGRE